jgi:hypothetical protein
VQVTTTAVAMTARRKMGNPESAFGDGASVMSE